MNEATATLITTADRSVKAIGAATTGLAKVVTEVVALGAVVETLSADIQQKEGQLADLTRQLDLNTRTAAAELNVRVAEAEGTVLNELLRKNALALISNAALEKLQTDFANAVTNSEHVTDTAVKAAEASLYAQFNSKFKAQEADFKVANAELVADLRALKERNQFLADELVKARAELTAERDARIQIAKAEAGRQGVVVNAGKQ